MNPRRAILVLAVLAALAPGCTDVTNPGAPIVGGCVVQGRMSRWTGATYEPEVRFTGLDDARLTVSVRVDAGGGFRVELPPGRYVASARANGRTFFLTPGGEAVTESTPVDTLRLEADQPPHELVFRLGALRLRAAGLAGLDGYSLRAEVREAATGEGEYSWSTISSADVVDGAVDVLVWPVLPDDYVVQASLDFGWSREGEHFWLPGVATMDEAEVHHIAGDSLVTVNLPQASPARVSGRVGGAWLDMGLTPPALVAVDADSNRVAGPWRVGLDGSFELAFLRPQPIRLAVVDDNLFHWLGGPDFAGATTFIPAAGEAITGVEVDVSGVLVRADFGGIDPGGYGSVLELCDPATRRIVHALNLYLSMDDAAVCVHPGQYLARLRDYSAGYGLWRTQWYDRAATADAATLVTVPDGGGTLVLNFVLETGAMLQGTVDFTGTGAGYVTVVLANEDEATVVATDFASEQFPGFAFTGLEAGRYKLGMVAGLVGLEEGTPVPADAVWYPGATTWPEAGVFAFAGADSVTGLVLPAP